MSRNDAMLKSMIQQVLNSLHHEVALALKMACQEYEGQAYAEMDQLVFLVQLDGSVTESRVILL